MHNFLVSMTSFPALSTLTLTEHYVMKGETTEVHLVAEKIASGPVSKLLDQKKRYNINSFKS